MSLKKVLLVIFTKFIVEIIAVNLLTNPDKFDIVIISKPLNEILQSCFQNYLNPLIITEQSSKYLLHKSKQTSSSASIIMINDDFKIQHDARNYNPLRGTFVLTDDQLNKTIPQLQSTPWWNTESYFVLNGPSSHSCADASKMLLMMWKRKILSVVYLCYNIDKEAVMLYTFNPFNNYAPHPWKLAEEIQDKPDSPWTLYKHQYLGGIYISHPVQISINSIFINNVS